MNPIINWEEIDTILLDMDGTLLDLNYDLHFWLEHLPLIYASQHQISHEEAKLKVIPMLEAQQGKLKFAKGDFGSMIKDPRLAGPFIKSFALMSQIGGE